MNDDTRTVSKWEFVPALLIGAEHATVIVPVALDHPFAYLLSSLYICALVLPRVSFCSFRHLFPNIYYLVFQKFRPLFVPFLGSVVVCHLATLRAYRRVQIWLVKRLVSSSLELQALRLLIHILVL